MMPALPTCASKTAASPPSDNSSAGPRNRCSTCRAVRRSRPERPPHTLMAYAAALESVACGPPAVHTPEQLVDALGRARPNDAGWIRGIGYHESVAGNIDRGWLDRHAPSVLIRVQHRSGRQWIVNSAGLECLAAASSQGCLPAHEEGRFYDQDRALGRLWGRELPPIGAASRKLASFGVTGLTDLTPQTMMQPRPDLSGCGPAAAVADDSSWRGAGHDASRSRPTRCTCTRRLFRNLPVFAA